MSSAVYIYMQSEQMHSLSTYIVMIDDVQSTVFQECFNENCNGMKLTLLMLSFIRFFILKEI